MRGIGGNYSICGIFVSCTDSDEVAYLEVSHGDNGNSHGNNGNAVIGRRDEVGPVWSEVYDGVDCETGFLMESDDPRRGVAAMSISSYRLPHDFVVAQDAVEVSSSHLNLLVTLVEAMVVSVSDKTARSSL